MPRVYKPDPHSNRRYKIPNKDDLEAALRDLKENQISYRDAAEKYGIHRSVLFRHATKIVKAQGGQPALDPGVENYIIENLNICAEWGYPMDTTDLCLIVKAYLDRLGVTIRKFKNNTPGREFCASFLKRHKAKISLRLSQNIKKVRAEVTSEVINDYFDNLTETLKDVPLCNIINYDETNLTDDPAKKKIITKRGTKYPERVMNHSKTSTSIMIAASADGQLLPPFVVYKSTHLYDTWTTNGPKGSKYNRSTSGWFDSECFADWVKQIAMPYFKDKPGKKIMIGDNLSSHLSIDLIKLCKDYDIHFVFLPANSTHLTQPLDVSFFRPMKRSWKEILLEWKKAEGRKEVSIPKGQFPKLLRKLFKGISENSKQNIISGFFKCGISPIDRNEVLSRLPGYEATTNNEINRRAVDESVITILKELRYPNNGQEKPKRKKKLSVQPGKSACNLDDNEEIENVVIVQDPTKIFKSKGKGPGKRSKVTLNEINQGNKVIAIFNETGECIKQYPHENSQKEILTVKVPASDDIAQQNLCEDSQERTLMTKEIPAEEINIGAEEIFEIMDEVPSENLPVVIEEIATYHPKPSTSFGIKKEKKIDKNTLNIIQCIMCCAKKDRGHGWVKCMACKHWACLVCNDGYSEWDFICGVCLE